MPSPRSASDNLAPRREDYFTDEEKTKASPGPTSRRRLPSIAEDGDGDEKDCRREESRRSTNHVVRIRRHQSGYLGRFAGLWGSNSKRAWVGDIRTLSTRHGRMRTRLRLRKFGGLHSSALIVNIDELGLVAAE